jgi:2,5-furandicarboxylate decarboxylase 1
VTEHQSVRAFLRFLEESGDLLRVSALVDPVYELGAYLWETATGPAVLFERVAGHKLAAFGNLLNSRGRIARALGTEVGALHLLASGAIDRRCPPVLVGEGPCTEVVLEPPSWAGLPVPRFFAGETGSYVTAGVIVAKGRTGKRNVSFARLKILDDQAAFIGIAPTHHLAGLAREAAAAREPLEVAVTIGNHPAVLLAAAYYLSLGDDEFEVAGALLGEPLELVRCATVSLEVPAHAEIVAEGLLYPWNQAEEGPVSEFSGLFQDYGRGPVVTVRCITMRQGALFQVILPGYAAEHVHIGAVAIAAGLEWRLRKLVPAVAEVAVTAGGCGRLHAVVALHRPERGDADRVIREALTCVGLIKRVTVVDDDIDIHNPVSVEWALATRMKADRDLLVLPGMISARADPLAAGGRVAKLGINATRRSGDRADWTVAAPPPAILRQVRAALRAGQFPVSKGATEPTRGDRAGAAAEDTTPGVPIAWWT